jgi:signal transduction histidine kinase
MLRGGRETTKFETIIDLDVLKLILDSFFAGWEGSYYLMPADASDQRLLEDPGRFSPFCHKVHSTHAGTYRCSQHDRRLAQEAFRQEQAITTLCHAGMLGFVIPILVDGEPLATIFFGQGRSWLEEHEIEGGRRAAKTESDLGLEPGMLLSLRACSPRYTEQQFSDIKSKLVRIANYVSELGHEKKEAQETKKALEMQLREAEDIRKVVTKVMKVEDDWALFWRRVDNALTEICRIIGARYSVFLTYGTQPNGNRAPTVQSVGNLEPQELVGNTYPRQDPWFRQIVDSLGTTQPPWIKVPFHKYAEEGTICHDIRIHCSTSTLLDTAVLLPIDLGDNTQGILIFFLDEQEDVEDSLAIEQEMEIVTRIMPQIALAYQNHELASKRRTLDGLQRDWLENVSHQLLAPLTSIEGHAERFYYRFRKWLEEDEHLIDSTLETLMASSKMAARLARNYAWVASDHDDFGSLDLTRENDLVGLLIACARNIQGLAAERRLYRVHVVEASLDPLNGQVALDRRLFSQAVSNLLDNAVKYADKWTEVLIHGEIGKFGQKGYIHITNRGIPITKDEIGKIFKRGYRSPAAIAKYAVGTGIGLPIAQDIVWLHNGYLGVNPSTPTGRSFRTTFTIELPLLKQAPGTA